MNKNEIKKFKPGIKFDVGKLDYTLLPFDSIEEVIKVLQHGEKQYGRDNWKNLSGFPRRYLSAAFRHLISYTKGEKLDPETGLHHLAHLVCCCLFVVWKDKKERGKII